MSEMEKVSAEVAMEESEVIDEQETAKENEPAAEENVWQEIYDENHIKLELKLTRMDVYTFLMYHAYFTFTGLIGILLSMYCLVRGIIQIAGGSTDSMTAMMMVIGIWFLFISPVTMLKKTSAQMKTNPTLANSITYWFTEKGMLQEQGQTRTGCKWNMITKAVFLKNIWILYAGKVRGTILPVKQFKEHEAELRALIQAHTGKKR